ncbi:hypothetical protein AAFF_G00276200 [Aldrovandia affinis]|uniref:Uncharacterized protein n=1 Tax=Aldrovandia affinis TaxID=143900 RepID=A0AAD7RD56_9TELE|nr:hypothetical protein AAFF_G00276200 [Aldrovandia affinis]
MVTCVSLSHSRVGAATTSSSAHMRRRGARTPGGLLTRVHRQTPLSRDGSKTLRHRGQSTADSHPLSSVFVRRQAMNFMRLVHKMTLYCTS